MITVFRPSTGQEEIDAVARVLKSGWIGIGPETEQFEKDLESYIGAQHMITTNSATAALHLSLIAAGVAKGDEVISPALTFISTNHVILYQGATPVFCDVDVETLCADPQDIIRKITPRTKAIIVVHYGGHAVDLDPLVKIARERKIALIEDAAHALGGKYKGKMLGTIGDFGCYSFHAVKGLAMGDGGAVFTRSKKMRDMLMAYRWMGISKDTWKRSEKKKYSWAYDIKYVGFKYHTNDILAAIGRVQLKKLPGVIKKKRKIFDFYQKELQHLSWLTLPVEKAYCCNALHNYCIKIRHRDKLSAFLAEKGIATTVHYEPNNHYPMYKKYQADIPVTEKVWKEILLLPFHPELTESDIAHIVDTIKTFKS